MNQLEMLSKYVDENRPQFNEELFYRSDDGIIEQLKSVILSCQRDGYFTIKVLEFEVIDDYEKIQNALYKYEEDNKPKSRKVDNPYEFINLKDSDIKLLRVRYFTSIKKEDVENPGKDKNQRILDVYIAVPRIVNKYYMRLKGNMYSAMYQVVEQTYNNATTNSKKPSVVCRLMFMKTVIYRFTYTLKTTKKESIKSFFYSSKIFSKSLGVMKYMLAKYGLLGCFEFLGINEVYITDRDINNDMMYTFEKNGVYISVPRMLFDADSVVQSLVCTIYRSINKETHPEDLFNPEFWVCSLGLEFNNGTVEKGLSILQSLEGIYDINTHNNIRLPEEYKSDIYKVLRWLIREFNTLRTRDNLDISFKRIRLDEYIASLYVMKLLKGIYHVADLGKKANIDSITKAIKTNPMYLVDAVTKCKLVNYRNMVNDLDAITALKYTYKGIAGLGETNSNSISDIYRAVHKSHIGRVDLDSSSASDPGITGTLCPLGDFTNRSFSDYEEPNFWEEEYDRTLQRYRQTNNIKEIAVFKNKILNEDNDDEVQLLEESVDTMRNLIVPAYFIDRPEDHL